MRLRTPKRGSGSDALETEQTRSSGRDGLLAATSGTRTTPPGGGHTADAKIVRDLVWHGERDDEILAGQDFNPQRWKDGIAALARLEAAANRTAEETREKWAWNQKAGEMADQRNAAEAERDAAHARVADLTLALRKIDAHLETADGAGFAASVARAVLGGPE